MSAPQSAGETAGTGGSNARTSAQAVLGSPEGQPLKKRGKEREQPDWHKAELTVPVTLADGKEHATQRACVGCDAKVHQGCVRACGGLAGSACFSELRARLCLSVTGVPVRGQSSAHITDGRRRGQFLQHVLGRDAGREAAGLAPSNETTIGRCSSQTAAATAWADAELRTKREQKRKEALRKGSLAAAFSNVAKAGTRIKLAAVYYAIALFFYATNTAFAVAENSYCRAAFTAVFQYGAQTGWDAGVAAGMAAARPGASQADKAYAETYPAFDVPDWQKREPFRTTHLKAAVADMKEFNAQIIQYTGSVTAATYVSDGWRDGIYKNEQINEFLLTAVGCIFVQAVFTAANGKSGQYLSEVMCAGLRKAMAMGANVRFVITDGAANARECGKLVMAAYHCIFAYVCVAHGLDLAFEDIGKLEVVKHTLKDALELITFILSFEKLLSIFSERAELKLMKPAATRFGYALRDCHS